MVAGKVKSVMGLQKNPPTTNKPKPDVALKPPSLSKPSSAKQQQQQKGSSAAISRSFGVYFPRASAQVHPRPPDVSELHCLVEELQESESRLKTELLEQKLRREFVAIVPVLENVISSKDLEIEWSRKKIECLKEENERLRLENEFLHTELSKQNQKYEKKIKHMQAELLEIKRIAEETQREHEEASSSSSSSPSAKFNSVTVKANPNVQQDIQQMVQQVQQYDIMPHVQQTQQQLASSKLSYADVVRSSRRCDWSDLETSQL